MPWMNSWIPRTYCNYSDVPGRKLGSMGYSLNLTWPMAKRLKLLGITYLVGKIKFKLFFFRVHWLSE